MARQNPRIFPATFDLVEFERDMTFYEALLPILAAVSVRYETSTDTLMGLDNRRCLTRQKSNRPVLTER